MLPSLYPLGDNTQWTETVLAKDYIEFLDLLWKRVRPDLLFPPPPPPVDEKPPPPTFSTTMYKKGGDKKTSRGGRSQRRKAAAAAATAAAAAAQDSASSFPLESAAVYGGATASYGRRPPPHPTPPPRTPAGLLALQIPGFRPKEAQRAAWIRKGGLIDPEAEKLLRPEAGLAETGGGGGYVGGSGWGTPRSGQEEGQRGAGESGMEKRGRRRLLAAGVEREEASGRPGWGRAGRKGAKGNKKGMDSVWDFAARTWSTDPREVGKGQGGAAC